MPRFSKILALILYMHWPSMSAAQESDSLDAMILDNSDMTQGFLMGTIKGFLWANIALKKLDQPMLYCQPSDIDSTLDLARRAATVGKAELRFADRTPENLTIAVYLGLLKFFPCQDFY